MQKIIVSVFSLFILLLLSDCQKERDEKKLEGKWTASINNPDACGFNQVTIEFQKNSVALLNYSNQGVNKWNTPKQCKWWIDKNLNLFIVRFDAFNCDVCSDTLISNILSDTNIYFIANVNNSELNLQLVKRGGIVYFNGNDLFFSEYGCPWVCPSEKTLDKNN